MAIVEGFENTGAYRTLARACGPFQTAKELVRIGVTPDEADRMVREGRIDTDTHRWLRLANEWCAFRYSSDWQERAYARLGSEVFNRRIARMRRLFGLA